MDEPPTGCWTNHHSILAFRNQWYLFYHHNDLSPGFDKNRSVRIDSLSFAADGSIQKVRPTLRGVGLTSARQKIQLDRYSRLSERGAAIAFLDTANTFRGWKTVLTGASGWVQYNGVDFGQPRLRGASAAGATVQIRLDHAQGPLIAQLAVPKGGTWQDVQAPLLAFRPGRHALYVSLRGGAGAEIDWVSFE